MFGGKQGTLIAKFMEKSICLRFLMEILKNNSKADDKAGMVKAGGAGTRMDKPAGRQGRVQKCLAPDPGLPGAGDRVPLTSERCLVLGSPGTGPRAPRGQDPAWGCNSHFPAATWTLRLNMGLRGSLA